MTTYIQQMPVKKYRPSNRADFSKIALIIIFTLSYALLLNSCQSRFDRIANINNGTGEKILALGDSITAGYGLDQKHAYPYLLSQKINLPIVNLGVSGDRTEDALARLSEDVLRENPWMVIVALGGNDFLKKVPKTVTEQNLKEIIAQVQAQKAITVILGMNLGLFTDEYKDLYQRVAEETNSYLIPQVLKGIIDHPKHRQQDLIHPNQIGQEILADKIALALDPLLKQAKLPVSFK
ncbi:MAG: GDSL-type esterase/lipase family protein [Pleurocapsa sp. MO_226.B13]|nr:GDSL-type esterase/lipase family protein [Pleurocapsa sp. MO_226.B13]